MASPLSPRDNPHIRLNSGTSDILDESPAQRPTTARQNSARSLTQSIRPGTAPSPASPGLRSPSVPSLYKNDAVAASAEHLLPPKKSRTRAFRDESPAPAVSRRSSWDSDSVTSRDSRYGPFASPFDDSRAPSRAGSEEDLNTQTVSEKFNITPSAGLLLFPEDVEKDDWLHNPDPNEKNERDCDVFTKRGLVNVGALVILTVGLLVLFIGYPILTFVHNITAPSKTPCSNNPLCIAGKEHEPLLKNIRTGLIDPDTPEEYKTRKSHNGKTQKLVFSDEFNDEGRTFYDGDDPFFQAVDIWYGATQDLEWYEPDAVSTGNGTLNLEFTDFANHGLNYRSGMIQSWNKLCYKGGHLEASISLAGSGEISGFWPGFWTMGNLARPGYLGTTEGLWPYSYHDECDVGITPNQSSYDGLSYLPGMRLPACTCSGEDHPNPGKSRSAPEIDALEGSVVFLGPGQTNPVGSVSQSLQIAPFDIWYQPDYDFVEVYDQRVTEMNAYKGGPFQEAFSGLSNLNNDWYDGKAYQKYAFEYTTGDDGFITWYVGDSPTWSLYANSIGPNGNIGARKIPEEPMSVIANLGMSNSFAAINLEDLQKFFPATMRIDYIRIYQDPDDDNQVLTCDPPDYPTTQYIRKHPEPYANPNLTDWKGTKYDWPKNSFMNDCKS
ncbi:beta-glucan synthesis-associated protein [Didymosphaeria variabile]|uniref:Beta-glucan synthesis-associated protein n=1 Tax=Didymosphaeria variabile TaxID=1932322 RepID=A0A9W9CDB3_9PLEO|nr:beta-glucan synthesis-associated protein [Didymosphaeria variabile]KAJ4356096.1 beta-glucan synthesis-associated protein [Didymosphaeria variabile]